jgi:Ca2+-transporting ATPase
LQSLKTSENGLTEKEAEKRLKEYGLNRLEEDRKKSLIAMLIDQIKDPLVLTLLVATIITFYLKEFTDAIIIIVIVILNTIIGFYQQFKAEKALEELKSYAPLQAKVIREGKLKLIEAEKLVPGDIIVLDAGDIVPADARLTHSFGLKIDESILTGESVPVEKNPDAIFNTDEAIADRINMVFKGTHAVHGSGRAVVVATGRATELGKIGTLIQTTESDKTPLQKRLEDFSKKLTAIVVFLVAFLFMIGLLRGGNVYEIFLTSVSLAVAAVPEALPAVVTIILSLGAAEMAKSNALIRHLPAVETLGSTDFICTDKTGTLTLNKMTVRGLAVANLKEVSTKLEETAPGKLIKRNIVLNHECRLLADGKVVGDPTEIALLEFAGSSISNDNIEKVICYRNPFDSKRKMMSVAAKEGDRIFLYVKGSPEAVINRSLFLLDKNGELLPIQNRDELLSKIEAFAIEGYRTLAFAYKEVRNEDYSENNLVFLGIVLLIDPPRPEAKSAIEECYRAGIKVAMITGDHPETARRISSELGIKPVKRVLTGKELESMPLEDFEEIVEHVYVYARVSPEQKLKIVTALQDKNHVVAMTGDGINDAPALKKADIGISMGITGTEVAKEVADMILLDDNFATIVKAVRQGRRLYDNIKKFIKYTLGSNTGEIVAVVTAPLLGLPIPIKPVHILWINLVTDGLPGIAMAFEKEEPDVMDRPPRPLNESIFAEGLGWHIVWVGFLLGLLTLFSYQLSRFLGWHNQATTIAFTVLCLSQLGHALAIRSRKYSTFNIGFFSNWLLIFAVILTFLLQLSLIYIPQLNKVFKTTPLSATQLALTLIFSCVIFIAVEIEKYLIRRYDIYNRLKKKIRSNYKML